MTDGLEKGSDAQDEFFIKLHSDSPLELHFQRELLISGLCLPSRPYANTPTGPTHPPKVDGP